MVSLETSIVIDRPVEEVFELVENPENNLLWQSGILESKLTSEGPIKVGSTFSSTYVFLGRRIEIEPEITQYEPNKNVAFKVTSGPVPIDVRYTFESIDGGTRVSLVAEWEVGGLFKFAVPLVERSVQRQVESSFSELKLVLEGLPGDPTTLPPPPEEDDD